MNGLNLIWWIFGINKCATMVIRPDTPLFQNKRDPIFYLAGQPIPLTKCYTYLGILFDKSLCWALLLNYLTLKLLKLSFLLVNFFRIPKFLFHLRRLLLTLAPLLGSNKARTNNTQKLINKGLRWVAGIQKAKSFINVYSISKDLNIPPLSAKYFLSQVKCFDKWKDSNCIISYFS